MDLCEDAVAERLGVSRKELAELRGPEGARWRYGPNRRVVWTQQGVAALLADLGATAAKNGGDSPEDAILTVLQTRFSNRRVLLAYQHDPVERLAVYLGNNGDNARFLPGMKILARQKKGSHWTFEGNPDEPGKGRRMPRAIGRW